MKTLVGCLCFLIVTTLSEACAIDKNECLFDWNVAKLENCTVDMSDGNIDSLTCPDFRIYFNSFYSQSVEDEDPKIYEYQTTIECSPNAFPYKLLSKMKSNRNSLVFENCQLPEDGSIADGWPELEYLNFTNYGTIGPLKREHFSGLNKLWNLRLYLNSNNDMPDDLFADATKLKEVFMIVKQANKNVFKNLNELERLEITINSDESLNNFDTSEMKNLPSFKTLELRGHSFTRLTKKFFEGCLYLENLRLIRNTIDAKNTDADAFEPLTNLKTIKFLFNKMTSLPEGLFSRNLKLEKVEILFSDELKSLPSRLLSNLPNLREIEIQCKLASIPSDLIRGSTNLEILNLQSNELTSLPRDLLQDHSKLKKIKLYGNKFNSTSSVHLDNKSDLTEVTFD